jgi:hypothetical protein
VFSILEFRARQFGQRRELAAESGGISGLITGGDGRWPIVEAVNGAGLPWLLGDIDRSDVQVRPPGGLVAVPTQFVVVVTAERDGEFVAHLAAQCPGLRKFEMMRVARLALADHA